MLILKGHWWLPDSPEIEVPGEFRFSQDEGGKLELQGDLHVLQDGQFHPPIIKNEPLILGISSKGREVSLLNCDQTKGKVSFGEYIGSPETDYRVNYALVGVHVPSPEAAKFKQLKVRFTYLEDWLDQNLFVIENLDPNKILVHSEKPEPIKVRVGDYIISFGYDSPLLNPRTAELVISHQAWVTICSETDEKPLELFLEVMRRIQDFITLGVGEPVYPLEVEGYSRVKKYVSQNGQENFLPIQIKYLLPWSRDPKTSLQPSQMIFTIKAIQDQVETILNRWFDRAEDLKPVLDITFSLVYQKSIYSEFRFLGMVQAIETYHRRRYGGKYMPDDVFLTNLYPSLVRAIPAELDAAFKQSLKFGKLRYANEFSLRKRLRDLTNHLAEFLSFQFLKNIAERNEFVEMVCDTRNYLTHYDPALKPKAMTSGRDLYILAQKLRFLLEASLLEEVGFEASQINTLMLKNWNYANFR